MLDMQPLRDPRRDEHARTGRRGRRQGVDVRPGSVKQARMEAGLSLGQVAGASISRTAIFFVETGKSRPSMETLMLIAERTGRPLDYFLAQPSTMEPRSTLSTTEPELLTATGDYHGAIAAAQALIDAGPEPEVVARLQYLMANAYLQLARPVEAQPLISAARAYFERSGDVLMIAECLGREASGAYLQQLPSARGLAERGLELCRSLKPVPKMTEGRLLSVLGGVHATNHDWPAAIQCYEQAIASAEVVQDLRRLSLMYAGLSLAYEEMGRLDEAARYSRRAVTIHETLDDRLSLARSENNLGVLLIKRGDLAEAEQHIRRGLALFDETGVEIGKANVLMSMCELNLARHGAEEADDFARRALEVAARCGEAANVAEAHQWIGLVAAARGDDAMVDVEFAHALAELEELGAVERLSHCHIRYAEVLEQRGDLADANEQLKQAIAGLRPTIGSAKHAERRSATA